MLLRHQIFSTDSFPVNPQTALHQNDSNQIHEKIFQWLSSAPDERFKEKSPRILLNCLCRSQHSWSYFVMKCCNLLFGFPSFIPTTLSTPVQFVLVFSYQPFNNLWEHPWTYFIQMSFLKSRVRAAPQRSNTFFNPSYFVPNEDFSWGKGNWS